MAHEPDGRAGGRDYRVGMVALTRGAALRRGLSELRTALPDATIGEPDQTGVFEIELRAKSFEAALEAAWDAVAAGGSDDEMAFAEHPDIPEHWRHRVASPSGSNGPT
ncbi:MAG: hypothetical protein JWN32_2453 [Solirubrobacterales bacterium]|nr:hypothetical protein [Solirubrobacterales bacterium]